MELVPNCLDPHGIHTNNQFAKINTAAKRGVISIAVAQSRFTKTADAFIGIDADANGVPCNSRLRLDAHPGL